MSEPRTVWVTKRALTTGIEVLPLEKDNGDFIYVKKYGHWSGMQVRRKDAHGTLDAAQARVREMVAAKLKSLDKERAKLEKLARDGAKVVGDE